MSTQLNPKKETKLRPLNTFPTLLDPPSARPFHAHGDKTELTTTPKPLEIFTPLIEPDFRPLSPQPDERKQVPTIAIPSGSPWMYLLILSMLVLTGSSKDIFSEARREPAISSGPTPIKKPAGSSPSKPPNKPPRINAYNIGFEEVAAFPDLWNAALDRGDAKEVEKLFNKFNIAPDTLRTTYKSQLVTPLAKAALRGDKEMVMMLLRKGSDPYWQMPEAYGKKTLLDVVLKKRPKLAGEILYYLTFDIPTDDTQTHTQRQIISAVMDKNVDALRDLLKLDPALNEASKPLATLIADLACAEVLIKHPKTLDLLIKDRNGKEALLQKDGPHLRHLDKPVADYLFNAATKQKQARDAIIKAIIADDAETLTALLDKYQFHPDFTKHYDEFDSGSKSEGTFLLFAVRLQKIKCMNVLLAKGADPYAKGTTTRITKDGRASTTTPFAAVGLVATPEVLDGFMKHHPEIDINQNDGFGTLVFKAALADNIPMLKKALFTYKADPNIATTQDLILGLVKHKKFLALEILIEAGANLRDTPPTIAEILKNLGTDNAEVASLAEKIFLRAMETQNLPLAQSFIDQQWLENPSAQQINAAKKYFGTEHTITEQLLQNAAKKTSNSNESSKQPQQTAQWSMGLLGLFVLARLGFLSFGYLRKKESIPDGNTARTTPDDPKEKTQTDQAAKQARKLEDKKRTTARELERENARAEQEYIDLPNRLNSLLAPLEKLIDENKISPATFTPIKLRLAKIKEELQEIIIETNTNSLVNKVGSLKLLIKELEQLKSYFDKHTNCQQKLINLTQQLTVLEPDIKAALRAHNKKLKIISASTAPKKDQQIQEYREKYINPLAKISDELTLHCALLEKLQEQFDTISNIPISARLEACVKLQAELTTREEIINEFLKNSRAKVEVGLTRKEIDQEMEQEKPESEARDTPKKTEFTKKDKKKSTPPLVREPTKLLPPSAAIISSYSSDESSTFSNDDSSTSASGYDTSSSITLHHLSPAPTEADNFSGVLRISESKEEKNIRTTQPTAVAFFKQPKRVQKFQKFAQLKIQADEFNDLLPQPADAKSEISALAYQGAMFFFAENLMHTDKFGSSFGITHKGLRRLRDNLIYHREKFKDFTVKDWQIIYQCFMKLLFDESLAEPLGTETRGSRNVKLQLLIQDYGHKKEEAINYLLEDHDSLGVQFAKFYSVADSQPASEKLLWDCAKQFSIGLKGYKEYVRKVGMGYASMGPQVKQAKKQGDKTRHETTIDKLLEDSSVALGLLECSLGSSGIL